MKKRASYILHFDIFATYIVLRLYWASADEFPR